MLTTAMFGNEQANLCEQQNGKWEWNGSVNQWECLDTNGTVKTVSVLEPTASTTPVTEPIAQEVNTSEATSSSNNNMTVTKAVAYAAAPVFIAGAIAAAVVISPVVLAKWAFGK
jgi:hypothetical protein